VEFALDLVPEHTTSVDGALRAALLNGRHPALSTDETKFVGFGQPASLSLRTVNRS
jgi:hypothetical protein